MDSHKNFAYTAVATAPSPAVSGTSLVVTAGGGALLPAAPFNAVVWPGGVLPLASNAEIVRVTAISTDTLTITRAQEGSTAQSIAVGYQFAVAFTAKTLTDIESPTSTVMPLGTNPTQDVIAVTTNNGQFGMTIGSAVNAGDAARRDQSFDIGWNSSGGSGKKVAGEPALVWRFENYYAPTASPTYMEAQLQYTGIDGSIRRPFEIQVDRATNAVTTAIKGSSISLQNDAGTQYFGWTPGSAALTVYLSQTIDFNVNGAAAVRQRNAANNANYDLIKLNTANQPVIGGSGTSIPILVGGVQLASTSGPKLTNINDQGINILTAGDAGAYLVFLEQATPSAAGADRCRLYAKDNGSGKTQLAVIFSSGAEQILATQP